MPFYRVGPTRGMMTQSYWLGAGDEAEARARVAEIVPGMAGAANVDEFDCVLDSTHTPPGSVIISGGGITYSRAAKRPRDPNQLAKAIVDLATGEAEEKVPLASARKGGEARATVLTPKQRSEIARVAAEARWKKSD